MMFTSTATAPAATAKTRRGFGDQPRLLAQSIIASPRQHSPIETYMMRSATASGRCGAPRSLATDVSGSSTGGSGHARRGRGGAQADERDAAEAEGGQDDGGQRTGERAVREHPDDDAHRGLDAPAGDRRLGQLGRGRGVGLIGARLGAVYLGAATSALDLGASRPGVDRGRRRREFGAVDMTRPP